MLSHLRRRAEETLAPVRRAMLSTCGPADIQAADVECRAVGLRLYLLLPLTSDLLYNLETHCSVVLTCEGWQLHGCARILGDHEQPPALIWAADTPLPEARRWQALVEVHPRRLHIHDGSDGPLTLDMDDDALPAAPQPQGGINGTAEH